MEIYRTNQQKDGEVMIVRPLLNVKNLKQNILSYKVYFDKLSYQWRYKSICFALVNDELKIFNFGDRIHRLFTEINDNMNMLMLVNDKALKITIDSKTIGSDRFMDDKYEVVTSDRFRFSDTEEKRNYITNILNNTELDLSVALSEIKDGLKDVVIDLPNTITGGVIKKTLGEIWAKEEVEFDLF